MKDAARQAQRVGQRLGLARVVPHAAAAERGPAVQIVDGDDGPQDALGVVAEGHLGVVVEFRMAKDGHGNVNLACSGASFATPLIALISMP